MQKQKRFCFLLLTSILCFCLMPTYVSALEPVPSDNRNAHAYTPYASPVYSYLYEDNGQLVRVEYIDGKVVIETYNIAFELQTQKLLECELPKWGGFFAGTDYNFIILGQNNPGENDNVEVIRVIKYDKSWNQIDKLSLYGLNTINPFNFGSLRCAEDKNYLYIHTCHAMYKTEDGLNHQCNLTLSIRKSDMQLEDANGVSPYFVSMDLNFYVSHSFDQFILVDQDGQIVTYDHGDGYPRGAVLARGTRKVEVQTFSGPIGYNVTNASLGGLVETESGYVTAYHYEGGNVYLSYTPKNNFSVNATKVNKIWESKNWNPFGKPTPMLVSTGPDGGYVMWYGSTYEDLEPSETSSVIGQYISKFYYTKFNSTGDIQKIKSAPAELSDCRPISVNGKTIWYVTNKCSPVFYVLDNTGIQQYPTNWESPFTDVQSKDWYYNAVKWATQNNITSGTSKTTFGPDRLCTIEQIITFLWRANGSPEPAKTINFQDVTTSDYYYKAAVWASENDLISGSLFGTGTPCTRNMAITYLWKLAGSPNPSRTVSFIDINSNVDYVQAVDWAVEKNITSGTSATTFSPNSPCTRAQIMTFLYRSQGI